MKNKELKEKILALAKGMQYAGTTLNRKTILLYDIVDQENQQQMETQLENKKQNLIKTYMDYDIRNGSKNITKIYNRANDEKEWAEFAIIVRDNEIHLISTGNLSGVNIIVNIESEEQMYNFARCAESALWRQEENCQSQAEAETVEELSQLTNKIIDICREKSDINKDVLLATR